MPLLPCIQQPPPHINISVPGKYLMFWLNIAQPSPSKTENSSRLYDRGHPVRLRTDQLVPRILEAPMVLIVCLELLIQFSCFWGVETSLPQKLTSSSEQLLLRPLPLIQFPGYNVQRPDWSLKLARIFLHASTLICLVIVSHSFRQPLPWYAYITHTLGKYEYSIERVERHQHKIIF